MKPPDANESIWPCTKSTDITISSSLRNEYGVYTSTKLSIWYCNMGYTVTHRWKTLLSFNKVSFLHHRTLLSISMPRYPLMQYMINVNCIYMWLMPSPVAFTVVSYVMFLGAVCTQQGWGQVLVPVPVPVPRYWFCCTCTCTCTCISWTGSTLYLYL